MRTRLIASTSGVLLALAGVAGTALFVKHRAARHATASAASSAAKEDASQPSAALEPVSRLGWDLGNEYVYHLVSRLQIGPGPGDQATSENAPPEIRLSGTWSTLVVAERGSLRDVRVQLEAVKPESSGPGAVVAPTELSMLTQPFFVSYAADGRATEVRFPKQMPPAVRGLLRHMVACSQLVLPEPAASDWRSVEQDAAGEYDAVYRRLSAVKYSRTKTGYVRLVTPSGLKPADAHAPLIQVGASDFEIDEAGRVTHLAERELEHTPQNDVGLAIASAGALTLDLLRKGHRTDALGVPSAGYDISPLAADSGQIATAAQSADRDLLGDAKLPELVADLATARVAKDEQAIARTQNRLSALFRLDPSATKRATALMTPDNASALMGAVGFSGTPEAQQELAQVMSDQHADPAARVAAVDGMFSVEHPTPEARRALGEAASSDDPELKTKASYMLGVAANRIQDDEPDASKEIVSKLSQDFSQSSDKQDQTRLLDSLGNAGSANSLSAIESGLASQDPAVRDASARALRFVNDPKADALLSTVLTSDPIAFVRQGALFAASFRRYAPLADALASVCKQDTSVEVRTSAVSTLAQLAKNDPDALLLIDWMAQHEPDQGLRAQAQRLLQRPPS
jgi:hypothetical protein